MIDGKKRWLAFALTLPLLGLAISWLNTHNMAQRGTDWQVEITGYDPRDLLRGHYIRYRYIWPGDPALSDADTLCLNGTAPKIDQAIGIKSEHPVTGCRSVIRLGTNRHEAIYDLNTGIYYVPQTAARPLEQKLADPALKAIMTIRVRDDGYLRPVGISFQPRSAAERAALVVPEQTPISPQR
jgi:GDYXXLXY protein